MASQLSAVRSYAANERRLADLASLDRAKSLMFSNVSHELLAPLTLISGPLDDVLAEATPQDGHTKFNDSLTMARRNVNRLSRLVAMLMDIAALDAGKHGSFVRVNLGVLTRDVAGLFRKAASKSKLQYTVLCDERSPRRSVYVDMEGWEKIVCCLIENAIKYTTEGFVHVCLEYTSKSAVLTVTFTGVGMVEDVEQRLSLKEGCRDRGTSMGSDSAISLMLASKLVNLHHSDLEIESRTMRETPDGTCGTVFRVRLPLGSSHLAPESIGVAEGLAIVDSPHPQFGEEVATWYEMVVDDTDTNSSTVSSGDSKRSRGIDARVLNFTKEDVIMVVEDLPDAQQYMRTIFEPYCTVVVARNGQDALEKYDKNPPHLVIADVMLPVVGSDDYLVGLDLCCANLPDERC
jgi:CheY-like chemotaxis protein/nitrogen-specific signal transduction histidine kinase